MEKQPENHKPRKPAMTDTNQLPVLIEEAYRLFAPCRAGFPLTICRPTSAASHWTTKPLLPAT